MECFVSKWSSEVKAFLFSCDTCPSNEIQILVSVGGFYGDMFVHSPRLWGLGPQGPTEPALVSLRSAHRWTGHVGFLCGRGRRCAVTREAERRANWAGKTHRQAVQARGCCGAGLWPPGRTGTASQQVTDGQAGGGSKAPGLGRGRRVARRQRCGRSSQAGRSGASSTFSAMTCTHHSRGATQWLCIYTVYEVAPL